MHQGNGGRHSVIHQSSRTSDSRDEFYLTRELQGGGRPVLIVEPVMPGATRLMGYRALELRHYQQIIPHHLTQVVSVSFKCNKSRECWCWVFAGGEALVCTQSQISENKLGL